MSESRPYGQRGKIAIPRWRKDDQGRSLCRWCDTPVPKGRRTWCSSKCVEEWRERGDWNHIRKVIIARDVVCQMCGGRRLQRSYDVRPNPRLPNQLAFTRVQAGTWEVDHIIPCEDGGTDDPANLRLLCRPCHKDRTAKQRRDKAARRAAVSTVSANGDQK